MDVKMIYIILMLVFLALFVRNIFMTIFALENYNIHKKRLAQIQKMNSKKTGELKVEDLVETVTKPTLKYIIPRIKIKNLEEVEADLKLSSWDSNFSPIQFIALSITGKIAGVIMFLLFFQMSIPIAAIWGAVLGFGPMFLLNNKVDSIKEKLMASFPDFIRIVQGYLGANMPFVKAIEETIKYVSDEWQIVLKEFIIDCNLKSVDEALTNMKTKVDIFEVREFVALIKLTLEQGGNMKDGFEAQAKKIQEMQTVIIEKKIAQRQTMATVLQGPLLLCNLMIFGLPTMYSMMNMNGM